MIPYIVKKLLVFAVLVLAVSVYYKKRSDDIAKEKLDEVLNGLLRAEKKVGVDSNTRIALGFGGCEDIFVNAQELLERLNFSIPAVPEHFEDILTENEFTKMFAYFFRHGAAAE